MSRIALKLNFVLFLAFMLNAPSLWADTAPSPTNPAAPILQLQLQNQFVPSSWGGSGYSNVFLFQPVIPVTLFDKPYITRITLPFVSTPDPYDPQYSSANDFGDTTMITWKMSDIKDGFWTGDIGFGASLVLPTGADQRTGAGKWQLGPSFIYFNSKNPKIEWGILASQTWSFAGDNDRDSVSQLQFQPIYTYNLKNGWYLSTGDHIWTRDWKAKTWDLPLSFGPGRTFKMGKVPVSAYLIPYYNIGDKVSDKWGIKLSVAILFEGGFSLKLGE